MGFKVGVTGTREGLSYQQRCVIKGWFRKYAGDVDELHHGCCLGADAEVVGMGTFGQVTKYVGHPPTNPAMVAHFNHVRAMEMRPPLPYLERNRAIAEACDVLLAFPKGNSEELRSGTWATVRHARKLGRPVVIFWRGGTVGVERPELVPPPPPYLSPAQRLARAGYHLPGGQPGGC